MDEVFYGENPIFIILNPSSIRFFTFPSSSVIRDSDMELFDFLGMVKPLNLMERQRRLHDLYDHYCLIILEKNKTQNLTYHSMNALKGCQ